jgi:hypothetical protein
MPLQQLPAASCGRRCVEINPEGQSPFLQSAARMRDRWQRKLASTAGARAAPELDYVVAAAGSAAHKFLEGADVVVVDPPRKVGRQCRGV